MRWPASRSGARTLPLLAFERQRSLQLRAGRAQARRLPCCAESGSRLGVIAFAIGVDVTPGVKTVVAEMTQWQPLHREVAGRGGATDQEGAEVGWVPAWVATRQEGPSYRCLATREPLVPAELPGMEPAQLPFPTRRFEASRDKVLEGG